MIMTTINRSTESVGIPYDTLDMKTPPAIRWVGWRVERLTLEQAEAEGWNTLVADHPLGSVFQHTAYGRMVLTTFKQTRPYYLALLDNEGKMKGGLAIFLVRSWLTHNRLVSHPFAFYSDPMVRSKEEWNVLFDEVLALFEETRVRRVEIKAYQSVSLLAESGQMTPFSYHRTYTLNLGAGLETVWEGFHRTSVKQKIRKAESSGITVRPAGSEHDVRIFDGLLARSRQRLGLPPQNWEYFQNIWRHLVPLGLARFTLAEKDARPIGGLCSFLHKDTVFLAYIGTLEEFNPLGVGQALWWEAIQTAVQRGIQYVDLGKTSPNDEGLITYKTRWGAIEQEVPSFYYPCPTRSAMYYDDSSRSHQLARKVWRVMPSRLARWVAPLAYRHMG